MAVHVVVGASGPTGMRVAKMLQSEGKQVRTVSRRSSIDGLDLPHVACDATDQAALVAACDGAGVIYCCLGIEYNGKVWMDMFPKVVGNLIEAASRHGAVLAHAGDLYGYNPEVVRRSEAITTQLEMTPATLAAKYPKCRASATVLDMLLEAGRSGRCNVVCVLASDLYGPGIRRAILLGELFFDPLTQGRSALAVANGATRHSYTHIDDYCRALVLAAEDERAWNRTWHVPCAEPITLQQAAELAAGPKARVLQVWPWARRAAATVVPIIREIDEVSHEYDCDFVVESDFTSAVPEFGEPKKLTDGLRETLAWYKS